MATRPRQDFRGSPSKYRPRRFEDMSGARFVPASLIGLILNCRCMQPFQATAESRLRIGQPDKTVLQYLPAALQARMSLLELGMPLQKLTMLGPRRTGLSLRLCQLAK